MDRQGDIYSVYILYVFAAIIAPIYMKYFKIEAVLRWGGGLYGVQKCCVTFTN
jgi:hypothetical protein